MEEESQSLFDEYLEKFDESSMAVGGLFGDVEKLVEPEITPPAPKKQRMVEPLVEVLKDNKAATKECASKLTHVESRTMRANYQLHEVARHVHMDLVEFKDSASHVEWLANVILRELSDFELSDSFIQKRVEHPWVQASL